MLQIGQSFFRSIPRRLDSIINSRLPPILAATTVSAITILMNFVCNEKIEHSEVNWNYYSDEPGRIVWLVFSAFALGYNLELIARIMKQETERNASYRASALKALGFSTAISFGLSFIKTSLNAPITIDNTGFVFGNAFLDGLQGGSMCFSGQYVLKKFNFTILPIHRGHIILIVIGIILAAMQDILDFVFKQMIKQNSIEWNSYTSPVRLFIWHAIIVAIQGTMTGLTIFSCIKYADLNTNDHGFNLIQKILIPITPTVLTLTLFTQLALTTPINEQNAGYIVGDSAVKGVSYGLINAGTVCATFGLLRRHALYTQTQALLVQEPQEVTSVSVSMTSGRSDSD